MNPNQKSESDKLADGLAKKIVEEIEKRANEMTKQKNEELKKVKKVKKEKDEELKKVKKEKDEELKKVITEKDEELKKVITEKDEELKKVKKEKDEELKKIRKEKDEELKKVITEKDEMLKKVMKEKNEELEKVINDNDKMLEDERCKLEELENTNSALFIKDLQSTDEIQEARTELIRGFRDLSGEGSMIGVKRMGEVDEKPFLKVCQQRFITRENVELQHAILCSKWQRNITDSSWYPFKLVGTGEKMKEVADDEDEKLKKLSEEWGEDVKNAVMIALEELNEINPSGRYSVPVLWNFEHGRKATLREGIAHMTQQIKNLKCKRT